MKITSYLSNQLPAFQVSSWVAGNASWRARNGRECLKIQTKQQVIHGGSIFSHSWMFLICLNGFWMLVVFTWLDLWIIFGWFVVSIHGFYFWYLLTVTDSRWNPKIGPHLTLQPNLTQVSSLILTLAGATFRWFVLIGEVDNCASKNT